MFSKGIKMKYRKYMIDKNCLIETKGGSIGWAPAQVSRMKVLTNIQNNNWLRGKKEKDGI